MAKLMTDKYNSLKVDLGDGVPREFLLTGVTQPMGNGINMDIAMVNVQRIITCWNACEYVGDVALENESYQQLRARATALEQENEELKNDLRRAKFDFSEMTGYKERW